MIPKIIHYCWFGNNKKSKLIEKCIKSWRELCPDYEIIEWNESNFDININEYVKGAYESKMWAYVSDYARFHILSEYGGFYLDTDVQLLKPLDDLREFDSVVGFSSPQIVATGLIFACHKNNWLCNEVLKTYEGQKFINDAPEKILAIGRRVTAILVENGLKLDGTRQSVNAIEVFPVEYFNPTNGDVHRKPSDCSYSIHHYAATWFPLKKRILNTVKRHIGSDIMDKYYKIKSKVIKK